MVFNTSPTPQLNKLLILCLSQHGANVIPAETLGNAGTEQTIGPPDSIAPILLHGANFLTQFPCTEQIINPPITVRNPSIPSHGANNQSPNYRKKSFNSLARSKQCERFISL